MDFVFFLRLSIEIQSNFNFKFSYRIRHYILFKKLFKPFLRWKKQISKKYQDNLPCCVNYIKSITQFFLYFYN